MEKNTITTIKALMLWCAGLAIVMSSALAFARDLEYKNGEVSVQVTPGEPTQVQLPGTVAGGFRRKLSTVDLTYKGPDLIIFANEGISETGEAIIVRLTDGRSYSLRIRRATQDAPRDDVVRLLDEQGSIVAASEEEEPAYKEKNFEYAPPTMVSGLMREMMLVSEFGKKAITGYQVSDRYKGQTVLNDGTMVATIDKIFIGPNLWGYVIEAQNMLDQTQRLNPATFRIDGTRAVSAQQWELAPKPLTVEQQIAAKDKTKIYVITRAKGSN